MTRLDIFFVTLGAALILVFSPGCQGSSAAPASPSSTPSSTLSATSSAGVEPEEAGTPDASALDASSADARPTTDGHPTNAEDVMDGVPTEPAPRFALFGHTEEGTARTLIVGADTQEIHDAILLEAGGRRFEYREEPISISLRPCEFDEDTDANEGTVTRSTLVDLETGAELLLKNGPELDDADAPADLTHSYELVAGVGPYLFFREETYAYHCGAHGSSTAGADVFDLERREFITLLDENERSALTPELQRRAFATLDHGDESFIEAESAQDLELVAHWPLFTHNALLVEHQLVGSTCYACSDGLWGSYSASISVTTQSVPLALQDYAELPVEVRNVLADHSAFQLRGVYRIP
ncbi:MAG: hypothetical protein AAGF12_18565 [Myxococcota bacterium]